MRRMRAMSPTEEQMQRELLDIIELNGRRIVAECEEPDPDADRLRELGERVAGLAEELAELDEEESDEDLDSEREDDLEEDEDEPEEDDEVEE